MKRTRIGPAGARRSCRGPASSAHLRLGRRRQQADNAGALGTKGAITVLGGDSAASQHPIHPLSRRVYLFAFETPAAGVYNGRAFGKNLTCATSADAVTRRKNRRRVVGTSPVERSELSYSCWLPTSCSAPASREKPFQNAIAEMRPGPFRDGFAEG